MCGQLEEEKRNEELQISSKDQELQRRNLKAFYQTNKNIRIFLWLNRLRQRLITSSKLGLYAVNSIFGMDSLIYW